MPWQVCIPNTVVKCLEITVLNGNGTMRAVVTKLGAYLPQPTSARIKLQITTWSSNPFIVNAEGTKIRPGALLESQGIRVFNVSVVTQELSNCDPKLWPEECMQVISLYFIESLFGQF